MCERQMLAMRVLRLWNTANSWTPPAVSLRDQRMLLACIDGRFLNVTVSSLSNIIGLVLCDVGGAMGRTLHLRSTGRGFKSYSEQKLHNNFGQVVHTSVPFTKQYNLVPAKGQ